MTFNDQQVNQAKVDTFKMMMWGHNHQHDDYQF